MAIPKMQYCFNCGLELGAYDPYYGDIEACSDKECQRELSNYYRDLDARAREEAELDDYSRYR
jgi:hypothetical protein